MGQWLESDTVTALGPGLIPVRELRSKLCDMAKKKKKSSKTKAESRTVESCLTITKLCEPSTES